MQIDSIDDFARFQVRASLTVPLLQDHPWGLLCLHQCATARVWQPQEIELVTQISNQLAVALQQSELFVQTQQQAQAFAAAFHQLQSRQMQLMQQAKLSSLGQLMADLAEEINHPAGFICSSLSHANQYAQQLLELVELYQQEHTTPSPALQQALETLDLNFIAEDFPKLLAAMQLGGERIRQMVLALQHFSSPDAPQMQPTNLHEGIDNTLLILQHRLKPRSNCRGIQVVCEYGDVPLVECYPNQINQVFLYLISNAIDALESQQLAEQNNEQNQNSDLMQSSYRPQLTIRTLQIPDPQGGNPRVIICIADNGGGIPDVIQDKLFEPFFTTKSRGGAACGTVEARSALDQQSILDNRFKNVSFPERRTSQRCYRLDN
ncbi:sensor histidine kinase [Leptolyngbya sp. 7M]|uniref:sensor histidine kinase n=1 Tax=Leptolyngbya sp. 7M TaxID=2812896 RepID=UPI0021F1B82C|nr:GAF domain-containing sensor histidine kinase [Leptolyngbya sp. 7M]